MPVLPGQVNPVLNAPLALQSIMVWMNGKIAFLPDGDFRATLRAESVFFSPYTFINFHFAPFVFGNLSLITPVKENLKKAICTAVLVVVSEQGMKVLFLVLLN